MTLEITLPFGERKSVKNIVFSILSHEYPLKIIQLTNHIRKRYGLSVTFQAVRKAVKQLVESNVLVQEGTEYRINVEWVKKSKSSIDQLYETLVSKTTKEATLDSVGKEISVFTFTSLNKMMKFWQELIDDWFSKFNKNSYPYNYYQAGHIWEVLLHLEMEEKIMGQMKKKGVKPYAVTSSNTPLDRNIARFYKKIGVKTSINNTSSTFDKTYYVGTYGDMIVQTSYPTSIVKELDNFFKKNTHLEKLDISELSKIVNKKVQMKLTVIHNLEMAKQINESIKQQLIT